MHILLLNEYYPPDTSATAKMAAQVAETLASAIDVTVVAGRPSYDPESAAQITVMLCSAATTRNKVAVECVGSTALLPPPNAPTRHELPFVSRARRAARACASIRTLF